MVCHIHVNINIIINIKSNKLFIEIIKIVHLKKI